MSVEKLAIDLDGCLANFNQAYARMFTARGYTMPDFADGSLYPATWNYPEDNYGVPKKVVGEVWGEIRRSSTFWRDLEPDPSAPMDSEVWSLLNWFQAMGHEVYYLTTRVGVHVHKQSRTWLKTLGIVDPTVLIVPGDKGKVAVELGVTMAVDDKAENLEAFCRYKHLMEVYQVLRPYNAHFFAPHQVDSTLEALRHFIERKGLHTEGLRRAA